MITDMISANDVNIFLEHSYRQGFLNGYKAASTIVGVVIQAIQDDPEGYDLVSIMQGLEKGIDGAYELMGDPPVLEKLQVSEGPVTEQ